MTEATSFYDFKPLDKSGKEVSLADYKGKVVLVVNTASKCGFTPQYAGLETLYKSLRERHGQDFTILGFPCNQFGAQEPGSDDEIQSFCQANYGVSFPIMRKIDVNGDNANPLFQWLKDQKPGLMGLKRVKWNFEKFLIGRDGSRLRCSGFGIMSLTVRLRAPEGHDLRHVWKLDGDGIAAVVTPSIYDCMSSHAIQAGHVPIARSTRCISDCACLGLPSTTHFTTDG
ncbi:hypothetical protein XA68_18167 [Ophiocordyceps unilateralis]|uniref:Glutathione peroxidase n=1 Tax=Ophiocordyceps unilateralis TaxID=268505 RepID=A0A2A9P218_OPHUN|nr:hypothetical protein XA68_18167 [Ophiocordyceps unilateralis]